MSTESGQAQPTSRGWRTSWRDSGLDWTVVRPPRLTDKALTGTYRTANGQNLRGGFLISRADVAHLMLRVLEQPQTIRQAIGVAY